MRDFDLLLMLPKDQNLWEKRPNSFHIDHEKISRQIIATSVNDNLEMIQAKSRGLNGSIFHCLSI